MFKPTYKYNVGSSNYDTSYKVSIFRRFESFLNSFQNKLLQLSLDISDGFTQMLCQIRVPSWTDRILFKIDSSSGIDAVLHSYESIDCIKSSDHKPVKAHLCLKVNNI